MEPFTADIRMSFKRPELPQWFCFATSINKSQGQTLSLVVLHLGAQCSSHGQRSYRELPATDWAINQGFIPTFRRVKPETTFIVANNGDILFNENDNSTYILYHFDRLFLCVSIYVTPLLHLCTTLTINKFTWSTLSLIGGFWTFPTYCRYHNRSTSKVMKTLLRITSSVQLHCLDVDKLNIC